MTSQASRTNSVEIIDANNVVVGTTTTQADGSFSCTVPAGLGEHVFTARSGDETSSDYHLTVVPKRVTDTFDDMHHGQDISGERAYLTLLRVQGSGFINGYEDYDSPPFLEHSKIHFAVSGTSANPVAGQLLITLKKSARKVRFGCRRWAMTGISPTVRYLYDTAEEYTTTITLQAPGWIEHAPTGGRKITELEFYYPAQWDGTQHMLFLDNFTLYQ